MNTAYRHIVEAVIRRVTLHLGASGEKGRLITVFTGASADFDQAVAQVKGLIMAGFCIEMVFSRAGQDLYGDVLKDMLAGFPHVRVMDESKWLQVTKGAVAVVVPMLSLNTLSRIALLMADNVPTNIILRALFTGVPVIMAQNGAVPEARHWHARSGAAHPPPLVAAVTERLQTIEGYGGCVVDIGAIQECVTGLGKRPVKGTGTKPGKNTWTGMDKDTTRQPRSRIQPGTKIVSASQVRMAHAAQADLQLLDGAKITPLARELAQSLGVTMIPASL